jgi:hypothetical protein
MRVVGLGHGLHGQGHDDADLDQAEIGDDDRQRLAGRSAGAEVAIADGGAGDEAEVDAVRQRPTSPRPIRIARPTISSTSRTSTGAASSSMPASRRMKSSAKLTGSPSPAATGR